MSRDLFADEALRRNYARMHVREARARVEEIENIERSDAVRRQGEAGRTPLFLSVFVGLTIAGTAERQSRQNRRMVSKLFEHPPHCTAERSLLPLCPLSD
jgi:hypothetical protein